MSEYVSQCGCKIHVAQWTSKRKLVSIKYCQKHSGEQPAQPSIYPRPCGVCQGTIESVEDLDWHGIGNCVPICEHCSGSGIGKLASEGERFCDICKQDISGHEFDGHCSVVCHKDSCIEKLAHPGGERVEQAIGTARVIQRLDHCTVMLPGHVTLDGRFPEGATVEIICRLVPTKGGADHD